MPEEFIRDEPSGIGVGGTPRKGKPKTEKERLAEHIGRYGEENLPPRGTGIAKLDVLFLTSPEIEVKRGGIVVDEAKAKSTRCHGYRIVLDGKTSELVWSPGIVGALSETEKKKYCILGTDWGKPPEKLKTRMKVLHEAGIFRK